MAGSRKPETSLTMSAPAVNAASATAARRVSIEIKPVWPVFRMASITGMTRANSSSTETGSAPGRVDSPPMSTHVAPASHMASAR